MWWIIGVLIGFYCIYKLMKSASDADDRIEIMRNKEIHIKGE